MKGSAPLLLLISISIAILGMLGFIYFRSSDHSRIISSNSNLITTPTISVRDYAPNLPMNQKTTILIRLSDSSEEKYIVPTSQVDTYIKSLPEGDHIVSKSP